MPHHLHVMWPVRVPSLPCSAASLPAPLRRRGEHFLRPLRRGGSRAACLAPARSCFSVSRLTLGPSPKEERGGRPKVGWPGRGKAGLAPTFNRGFLCGFARGGQQVTSSKQMSSPRSYFLPTWLAAPRSLAPLSPRQLGLHLFRGVAHVQGGMGLLEGAHHFAHVLGASRTSF